MKMKCDCVVRTLSIFNTSKKIKAVLYIYIYIYIYKCVSIKNMAKNEKLIVCQWQSPNGFFDVWKDILVHFIVAQKVSLVYYMHGIQ